MQKKLKVIKLIKNNESCSGFTLAELMVSATIIIIALAVFLSLYQSIGLVSKSNSENVAISIAEDRMSTAPNYEFSNTLTTETQYLPDVTISNRTYSVEETHTWVALDANGHEYEIANASDVKDDSLQKVLIKVSWQTKQGPQEYEAENIL